MRTRGAFLIAIGLAAALRFPNLAARPMHADEAVHADKFGTLLEGGGYAYDPKEYHGPTLYYLTLPSAWLRGQRRYGEIDEATLRSGPAALGVALVAAHLAARSVLGHGAAFAALFAAISPAMVFYSRYFIHEIPLVLWTFGLLLAAGRYHRVPGTVPALLGGVCVGLMFATKETAPLALGAMVLSFFLARMTGRAGGEAGSPPGPGPRPERLALFLLAAGLVAVVFFSSFLTHAQGVLDAVRAYGYYLDRARETSWHIHDWDYYLRLLIHFPSSGTPFWTEGLILLLAAAGAVGAWSASWASGPDPTVLRFLVFYSLLLLGVYSAIPYKTPWCLLGFLHGLILLAGVGASYLVHRLRGRVGRVVLAALLGSGAVHLAWQAYCGSFRFAASPRNPYVYAHTSPEALEVVRRLQGLARAHPDRSSLRIQVLGRENLWPLPFYLRGLRHVEWWTGVPESAPKAPVILLTPDLEADLAKKLYDLSPPGERELYTSIFDTPVELRPGVELRGYATLRLWEDYRRLEAESQEKTPGRGQ